MGKNKVYRRRFNFGRNIKNDCYWLKLESKKFEKSVDKMKDVMIKKYYERGHKKLP